MAINEFDPTQVPGIQKNNLIATVAPTSSNDATQLYEVGSLWFIPSTRQMWVCTDITVGSAVWIRTNLKFDQLSIWPSQWPLGDRRDDHINGNTNNDPVVYRRILYPGNLLVRKPEIFFSIAYVTNDNGFAVCRIERADTNQVLAQTQNIQVESPTLFQANVNQSLLPDSPTIFNFIGQRLDGPGRLRANSFGFL